MYELLLILISVSACSLTSMVVCGLYYFLFSEIKEG